ncbi:hypothetical protein [Kitasatospora aureofaciens]|nr:hypothetical protein [Kitasatospora aureofaciens]
MEGESLTARRMGTVDDVPQPVPDPAVEPDTAVVRRLASDLSS